MISRAPALIVLHGGVGEGPAERLLGEARAAAARTTIAAALEAGFERVIVATDSPARFPIRDAAVTIDPDPDRLPFSFGARVAGIIRRFEIRRPVVMGAGALPLLGTGELRAVADALGGDGPACVTNNFYSADITGWCPGTLLEAVASPARDNALPRAFRDSLAIPVTVLPRTTSTLFDLDTPTDLAILAVLRGEPFGGPVGDLAARVRAIMPLLCDRSAEILVAGRVGSQAWQYLERETACRVRLFSEERGLATAPPGYVARSALGFLLEDRGPGGFFRSLAALADGAFLDTRVLLEHVRSQASREDRFQSDLFAVDEISDPWLRAFTRSAVEAPGPVLLGGHSLVAGGLMALNDAAWTARERDGA